MLPGLLHQVAEKQRLKEAEAQSQTKASPVSRVDIAVSSRQNVSVSQVLPTLASLYGPEAVAEAEKSTAMAQVWSS